jgi:hypothetical protein
MERLLTSHGKTITNEELHPHVFTKDKHTTLCPLNIAYQITLQAQPLQNQQVLCSWSIKAHSANNVALGDQEH